MNFHPHWIWVLLIGFAIGYWMPAIGDFTLGRLYKPMK